MNDIFVLSLLLHASAHASLSSLPASVGSELSAFNATALSQAWFAYDWRRGSTAGSIRISPGQTPFTSPFDLRDYVNHHILSGPYSAVRTAQYKQQAKYKHNTIDQSLRLGAAVAANATDATASALALTSEAIAACAAHQIRGADDCAHLATFVRALQARDGCYSAEASASLRQNVLANMSPDERWRWQSYPASNKPGKEGRWQTLTKGVPCTPDQRWWVQLSSTTRWHASPEWAHANDKAPSLARCPEELRRMPSPCRSKMDAMTATKRRCHDDALPLCEPLLFGKERDPSGGCLVYSFGIGGEWSFEEYAAQRCEVHAFDPTTRLRRQHMAHVARHGKNIVFHYQGLGLANGGSAASLKSNVYGALGGKIMPLDALMETNGHTGRNIDLLKIDCEGCEWEAFLDISERTPHLLKNVNTIVLEIHVSTELQMGSDIALLRMAKFWRQYIVEAGFRVWYIHRNTGSPSGRDNNVHPLLVALGLEERVCCFELGLHRQ